MLAKDRQLLLLTWFMNNMCFHDGNQWRLTTLSELGEPHPQYSLPLSLLAVLQPFIAVVPHSFPGKKNEPRISEMVGDSSPTLPHW